MADTVVRPQRPARAGASLFASLRPLIGVVNRPATLLAGSRLLPFWSVVRHRGRRSGRSFATPVAARRTADGFAIPLAFGETADWCRNLIASGGGVVRWSGREYPVTEPLIVDAERATAAFRSVERRALRALRIQRVLLVRDAAP
jgi:deazaflavin-dependent oxidoreductase (nitroreductase family)